MEQEDPIGAGEAPARPEDAAEEQAPPEPFELELDGQVHTLPAALKGAFLRQADYTRKTQELADQRRALEAEQAAVTALAQTRQADLIDRAHLAALDQQLEAFADVDWPAFAEAEPQRAQALWEQFQRTEAARRRYASAVSHHDERRQLEDARRAAASMAETGKVLAREIDGWSPEVAAKLVAYAQAFGVTLDELQQAADPRLWKILHRAYQADQAGQSQAAAQAHAVRPAVLVAGALSGGGVRDELTTREWMARRGEQMRRAR